MRKQAAARVHARLQQHWSSRALRSCLLEGKDCSQRIARAHSIPMASVLSKLSVDGHVMSLRVDPRCGPTMARVGVRKASTFTGFCTRHDNRVFEPIDSEVRFEQGVSNVQIALLGLRATAREYWAKLNWVTNMESTLRLAKGGRVEELAEMYGIGHEDAEEMALRVRGAPAQYGVEMRVAIKRLGRVFDSYAAQSQGRYSHLTRSEEFVLPYEAGLACSVLFSAEFDLEGARLGSTELYADVADVALSILPGNGITRVVFSHHRRFSPRLDLLWAQLRNLSQSELRTRLSQLLVVHGENFVMSPTTWLQLPASLGSEIPAMWFETMNRAAPLSDYPEFDLFLPLVPSAQKE